MERVSGLELLREIPSSSPGELFEAYEPALERRVLVHRASSVEAGRSAEMAQRSGLQLLRRIEDSSGVLHVYEAIGGEPLRDRLARGAFERWDEGVELVADLIRACLARRTATRIEELWLDDGGKLRVLDFTGGNDGVGPPLERLITGVGRGALLGRGSGHDYPLDLPLHADPAVQEVLRGPQSRPEQLEQRLRSLLSDDRHPGPRRRILAMLLASGMAYIWLMSSSMSDSFAIATSIAILAFALRDVPVFLLVGLGLRQTDGLRAARWRCGLRTALVWVPIPLALWWGLAQHAKDWPAPLSVSGAVLAVGLLPLAHLVTTLRNPERGLIDALVGTRVVLR
jgi:hypothetical protein